MKRLPLLLEDRPSLIRRAQVYLLVPIAMIVFLPVMMIFVLALYFSALYHGARMILMTLGRKRIPDEYPEPHFLELRTAVKMLPDETKSTT